MPRRIPTVCRGAYERYAEGHINPYAEAHTNPYAEGHTNRMRTSIPADYAEALMKGEMVMSGAMRLKVVTIDGPSGVGKSTVSRKVAAALGWTYLDTGAMYRAVGFQCRQAGIALADDAALNALLARLDIRLLPPLHEGDDVRVFLHDKDISAAIRSPEAGMMASQVSALPTVRSTLTALQQKMGRAGEIVAEGRDTGTVVFPDAAWKFYLDAPPEERCRRRVGQLRAKGQQVDEHELLAQIIERDRNDRERTIAPLRMAEDAVLIDASDMTADEVAARMLAVVRGR